MTRKITLSAIQPPLLKHDTLAQAQEAHLAAVTDLLIEAAARDSDLAVLPEHLNMVGASSNPEEKRAAAETLDGPFTTTIRRLAASHRMAIILPIYRLDDRGHLRNSAVVVDRQGVIAGCYDKVHPTRGEMEVSGVVAGDSWPVFDLDFGRVGVMICHDNSFVESTRCLALNGAEIVAWPHVQSGWGDVVWDITLRSRAIDNGVYLVSSCFSVRGEGAWRPGMMVGRSGVVGQDGAILAEMSREVGVATTTVDLDLPRLVHSWTRSGEHPYAEEFRIDRRPDTYGVLTQPQPSPLEAAAQRDAPAGLPARSNA
jgi:N-carbamoylputrescine amidase